MNSIMNGKTTIMLKKIEDMSNEFEVLNQFAYQFGPNYVCESVMMIYEYSIFHY